MEYYQITPQNLIKTIPQLSQDDYQSLRSILFLYCQHQQRCEQMMRDTKGMSFDDVLHWNSKDLYHLYMDLTSNHQVVLKSRTRFLQRREFV